MLKTKSLILKNGMLDYPKPIFHMCVGIPSFVFQVDTRPQRKKCKVLIKKIGGQKYTILGFPLTMSIYCSARSFTFSKYLKY